MQFRLASLLLTVFAIALPHIGNAQAANKSWRPESVAAREAELSQRFEARGIKLGSPIFIRVYKQTSEMELWVQQGPRYVTLQSLRYLPLVGRIRPQVLRG